MADQTRRLRAKMTFAEMAMWKLLRDRRLEGLKFRRQTRIGPWIADFCCYELKLVIELDGGIHHLREEQDRLRDANLQQRGFTVLRFGNEAVLTNPTIVFDAVRRHADRPPPHPSGFA
ncbi:MAG: endonuclease domain-containing protein [Brevundimonas sp.]|uniref:endonuclease domain-containing protein n=1 Tax=Brevundimonas sp. TaxID=1871086 RepID=UPI00391D7107